MARSANTTIIKRIEGDDHDGHHGGAWKVAYADFMTAMMAFFLLLWILSSSDEQKLKGIAEYFTDATQPGGTGVLDGASIGPPGILSASNGAILARGNEIGELDQTVTAKWEVRDVTDTSSAASKTQNRQEEAFNASPEDTHAAALGKEPLFDEDALEASARTHETEAKTAADVSRDTRHESPDFQQDETRFADLQSKVLQAMQENPDLRPLQENLIFKKSEEGLHIQVIDQDRQPMFASGASNMLAATELLIGEIGRALAELPNQLVITGHTDAVPFSTTANYDNWDLSSDRANEARRILMKSGVNPQRLLQVSGKAHTEPLVAESPNDPSNRRISLILQYSDVTTASGAGASRKLASQDHTSQPQKEITPLDEQTFDTLRSVLR